MNAWGVLGIRATHDVAEIRRAYAKRLKAIDQRNEQTAFQSLRSAYELALNFAARAANAPLDHASPTPVASPVTADPGAPHNVEAMPSPVIPQSQAAPERYNVVDQRAREDARADELVQLFGKIILETGEEKAIEIFRAAMASDELQSFSLRDAIEWRLIFALANAKQMPLNFLAAAVDFFGWNERPDLLESGAGPALRSLLARREIQTRYNELRERANRNRYSAHFSKELMACRAARTLLSPFSPRRFRWDARSAPLVAEMRLLLADIDARTPDLIDAFLDAKTVAYWRRVVEDPPLSFRAFGVAAFFGFIFSAGFLQDRSVGNALGILLFAVASTVAIFFVASRLHRYWVSNWQSRVRVGSAIAIERSIGRIFPNAVRAGLGWKAVFKTTIFAPLLGLIAAGSLIDLRPFVGAFYIPLLILIAAIIVFFVFVLIYQIKHWKERYRILPELTPHIRKIVWYVLMAGASVAAATGAPRLFEVLAFALLANYLVYSRRK